MNNIIAKVDKTYFNFFLNLIKKKKPHLLAMACAVPYVEIT